MDFNDDSYCIVRWERNLEDIGREVSRLAFMCRVKLSRPGVIERIFARDTSVCGLDHPVAFRKLHDLLLMHYLSREKAAAELGPVLTSCLDSYITDQLQKSFPDF